MDKRTITLIVILFVLLIAGMFTYAFLKKSEVAKTPVVTVTKPVEESLPYEDITRINAKHFFVDGLHTFVGEISLPTPCDLLDVKSSVAESYPEQVTLNFTVINNAETCAQTITVQRFMVTAKASNEAKISATFMGRPVELNLIPPLQGETPEDFELFIKG